MNKSVGIGVILVALAAVFMLGQAAPEEPNRSPAISECGYVTIPFENGRTASWVVHFKKKYDKKPLVLVNEWDSKGTFVVLKVENVTTTQCHITGQIVGGYEDKYKIQAAYIVVPRMPD